MEISKEKKALRARLLDIRMDMNAETWSRRSKQIVDELKQLPEFLKAERIHCYVSMNQRHEIETHSLIQELLNENKKVIVPVTNFEEGTLQHIPLESWNELNENKWGILEPKSSTPYQGEFDVILVPLLAADKKFNRLGYGKGFYDRFLSSTNATKIGLLFHEYLMNQIPVDDHDEKLDILITDEITLRRNNDEISA